MESKKVNFKKKEEVYYDDINRNWKTNFMTQKELMRKHYDLTGLWRCRQHFDMHLYCGHETDFNRYYLFLELLKKYWYYNNDNRNWLHYFMSEATNVYLNYYQNKEREELKYELPSYYSITEIFKILKDPVRIHDTYIAQLLLLIFFNFGYKGKNAVVNFILGNWKWAFTEQKGLTWDFDNFFEEYFNKGGKNETIKN